MEHDVEENDAEKKDVEEPDSDDGKAEGVDEIKSDQKVRWMYENDNGWNVYPEELSREIEEASRDGKSEHTLGNNHCLPPLLRTPRMLSTFLH